jgi:hypothetical protein
MPDAAVLSTGPALSSCGALWQTPPSSSTSALTYHDDAIVAAEAQGSPRFYACAEVEVATMMCTLGTEFFRALHISDASQALFAVSAFVQHCRSTVTTTTLSFTELAHMLSDADQATNLFFCRMMEVAGLATTSSSMRYAPPCAAAQKVLADFEGQFASEYQGASSSGTSAASPRCIICDADALGCACCQQCSKPTCPACRSEMNHCGYCGFIEVSKAFKRMVLAGLGGNEVLQSIDVTKTPSTMGRPKYMNQKMMGALHIPPSTCSADFRRDWLPKIVDAIQSLRNYTPGVRHPIEMDDALDSWPQGARQ